MTRVTEVSQKEMARRTGLPTALGYAFPKKNEVLVRRELKGKARKKVLRHEMEHISKKEEGPWIGNVISGAASLFGARSQANAAEDAARATERATQAQLGFQKEVYEDTRGDTAARRAAADMALDGMVRMTGLPRSEAYDRAMGIGGPPAAARSGVQSPAPASRAGRSPAQTPVRSPR